MLKRTVSLNTSVKLSLGLGTALAGLFHVGSGICTFAANVGIMETTKVSQIGFFLCYKLFRAFIVFRSE